MIFHLKGTVATLLDRDFPLQTGGGEAIAVSTQAAGRDLGLNPGDAVEVLGGPAGPSTFASATAYKVLPAGQRIAIPVNLGHPPKWTPGPLLALRQQPEIGVNQIRNHRVPRRVTTHAVISPMNTTASFTVFVPAGTGWHWWMRWICACSSRQPEINHRMSVIRTTRPS